MEYHHANCQLQAVRIKMVWSSKIIIETSSHEKKPACLYKCVGFEENKSLLKISTFTVHIERLVLSKINCGLSRADVSFWPCVNDVQRLQGLTFILMLTNFT